MIIKRKKTYEFNQKFKDEWVWKLPRIKYGLNEDGINIQVCFEVSMVIPWVDNNEKKQETRTCSLVPHIGPRRVCMMGLRWNDKFTIHKHLVVTSHAQGLNNVCV